MCGTCVSTLPSGLSDSILNGAFLYSFPQCINLIFNLIFDNSTAAQIMYFQYSIFCASKINSFSLSIKYSYFTSEEIGYFTLR